MYQIYYAKSPDMDGFQETNQSHLLKTSHLAQQFGAEIHRAEEARLCGLLHDFGKYSQRFQDVLKGTASGVATQSVELLFYTDCPETRRPFVPLSK